MFIHSHHLFIFLSSLIFLPIFPAAQKTNTLPLLPSTYSPPATIQANQEQSGVTDCPLDLPDELFDGIRSACTGKHKVGHRHRSQCCPVLAAWLYYAYSGTALSRAGKSLETTAYNSDLPQLPDDTESCVYSLQKGLRRRGIELLKVNESCDVVYCYCGIKLHPLSCPSAFHVNQTSGQLVGDHNVHTLEKNCLSHTTDSVGGFPGVDGCSHCLNSLSKLKERRTRNTTTDLKDRRSKMQDRDCELMGLTWLLAKNRSAYIPTVSTIFQAIMTTTDDGSINPQSCTNIGRDGLPLAVASHELNNQSSSPAFHSQLYLCITTIGLLYISIFAVSITY